MHPLTTKIVEDSKDLTSPLVYRQPPRRSGTEGAVGHAFPNPESHFRKQYFENLNLLTRELKYCLQQKHGLPIAAMVETLLVTAANCTSVELSEELKLYENDIDLKKLNSATNVARSCVSKECEGS